MSVQAPVAADPQVGLIQRLWADCVRTVLQQVAGFPVAVEPETAESAAVEAAEAGKIEVWARFTTGQGLHGEMALRIVDTGAVRLAQVLMSEPADAAAPYDDGRREGYAELLRQIGGRVASGLKATAGQEISVSLEGSEAPNWPVAGRCAIRISGEKLGALYLTVVVSAELAEALRGLREAQEKKQPEQNSPAAEQTAPQEEAPATASGSNLELLLDVKLTATIRFGQRRMLLREILEIHPGAAIELDRHVHEPVELLVGGRVIALGEVVIADGNYGLRITEIVSPQQRIASLGK